MTTRGSACVGQDWLGTRLAGLCHASPVLTESVVTLASRAPHQAKLEGLHRLNGSHQPAAALRRLRTGPLRRSVRAKSVVHEAPFLWPRPIAALTAALSAPCPHVQDWHQCLPHGGALLAVLVVRFCGA